MKLQFLLDAISPVRVLGATDKEIHAIHFDSRKVAEGDLFVAQAGTSVDGHAFIAQCAAKGAAAIVLSNAD
ncbi:MAG: UDP-N-acetylmuramoyl-L-alanyl-D-glutamate--2,6-diaminopimelate ligase, partial [Paludibacteraceae bacterium]|nr:UDP-N-acetylmuramoyl-L-alanyl-D-glutamate--2,6-diaminopimelate ligase [Paludibacteraceae bacterium]